MTLESFDMAMAYASLLERDGHEKLRAANAALEATYKQAGLECHYREPGFPCWTSSKVKGYYNTPREVLEAEGATDVRKP